MVGVLGGMGRATRIALSIARTPYVLNARGVWSRNLAQQIALFKEAHQLAPHDPIIGGNWAATAKRRDLRRGIRKHCRHYNRLLDAAIEARPLARVYREARRWRLPREHHSGKRRGNQCPRWVIVETA
jgi:hypothetical protein